MFMAFLITIAASFYITNTQLTGFVRDYLYQQRIRQDSLSLEKLSVTVAPLFESKRSDQLNETILRAGGEMNGRLLLRDTSGKVQFDSFSELLGEHLPLSEAVRVIQGDASAYGIHAVDGSVSVSPEGGYVAYCASRLDGTDGCIGALVYISSVTEMIQSLNAVERQVGIVFIIVAALASAFAILFSRLITRPVNDLTRVIKKMGTGDLSVRAKVRSHDEMRTLAESYNSMAVQIENLDRSRNQFVSNASHELKTPLTTMKILLENVMYQPDMPQEMRTEFLTDMDHEIDRLSNVVSDLLTLTKMDSGKSSMNLSRFNLSETAAETIRLLTPQAEKRGQELSIQIMSEIWITADHSKVGQIIYNLTENALKYTPDGGTICVRLMQKGKTAVFSVQDNGIGIPQEDQEHIFDRFYRVDKARSRETGGTGLGLSIVRQLVQMHGGEITVESKQGKGSLFTVRLPVEGREAKGT